ESEELAARAAALDGGAVPPLSGSSPAAVRSVEHIRTVEVDGRRFDVRVLEPEQPWRELARRRSERGRGRGHAGSDAIVGPMQGTVLSVAVVDGEAGEAGAVICIVEAMKMENEVRAPHAGTIAGLSVAAGQPVSTGQVICVIAGEQGGGDGGRP